MPILLQASSQGRLASVRRKLLRQPRPCFSSWMIQNDGGGGVSLTTAVSVMLVSNWIVYQLCQMFLVSGGVDHTTTNAVGGLLVGLTSMASASEEAGQAGYYADANMNIPDEPPVGMRLAWEQSYEFFDDIPDQEWIQYYQTPARQARHYRFEDTPNKDVRFAARWNFFNWDRYFNCPHLLKVGGLGGGPKWTCDVERIRRVVARRKRRQQGGADDDKRSSHCLVYSIGSRGNYRWELGLVDLLGAFTCEIHVFDFSNFEQPGLQESKNIYFHQWGLGSSYSPDYRRRAIERGTPTFISFQEMRKRLGHENRTIDLFKIDCEICEWHSYKDWISADIRQVLIETHELPQSKKKMTDWGVMPAMEASTFFNAFQDNGFVLYSKEVNTQRGYGRSVEWSFIKLRPEFLNKQQKG